MTFGEFISPFLAGFVLGLCVGGFVVWCVAGALADIRWWREHGG